MKKIMQITLALVTLAALASCRKSQTEEFSSTGITRFTATILQTKTNINSTGKITWVAGDKITVTDNAANSAIYVAQSSGASTTFSLKSGETAVTTAPYTATYGDLTRQIYSATGANCPLSARTETSDFRFSCPYAVLKITATSDSLKRIDNASVTNNADTLAVLDCKYSNVVLSPDHETPFYIAVKPDTCDALRITFETHRDTSHLILETAVRIRSGVVVMEKGDLLPLTLNFSGDDWKPACVAAGTMITLWDGSQKAVEELEINDLIRTFDHQTGLVSSAPVCFVWESKNIAKAFTLTFEGGTEITVIEEHGFYDKEKREYAFINANNAKDYFGDHFYDADHNRWLELKSCKLLNKSVDAYSVVTSRHLNHLANGILSMCDGSIKVLANLFEFDEQMKFDEDKKAAAIEEFGLTPIEKILEYKGFFKEDYDDYNLMYLNVAIGKGLTSWDYVKALSDYCETYVNP